MKLPTIKNDCWVFLHESSGRPMIRYLPSSMDGFSRVKVRKRKTRNEFEETFNDAFFTEYTDLRNRAVFANGDQPAPPDHEEFYIFPPNGFKFMYSTEVKNSSEQFKHTFELLVDTGADLESSLTVFKELLHIAYSHDRLVDGLDSNCEIIIYDIPYFYAVKKSLVVNYIEWFYSDELGF